MNLVRILEVLYIYYMVNHFFACLFIHVASFPDDTNPLDTWLRRIPSPQPGGVRTSKGPIPTHTIYIHALLFCVNSMSHIAIGDITSISFREKAFNIFMLIMYAFIYALLFGNIVSMVADFVPVYFITLNERYHQVVSKIDKRKIPKCVRHNMKQYYDSLWLNSKGIAEDFLLELPPSLRHDILIHKHKEAFS